MLIRKGGSDAISGSKQWPSHWRPNTPLPYIHTSYFPHCRGASRCRTALLRKKHYICYNLLHYRLPLSQRQKVKSKTELKSQHKVMIIGEASSFHPSFQPHREYGGNQDMCRTVTWGTHSTLLWRSFWSMESVPTMICRKSTVQHYPDAWIMLCSITHLVDVP